MRDAQSCARRLRMGLKCSPSNHLLYRIILCFVTTTVCCAVLTQAMVNLQPVLASPAPSPLPLPGATLTVLKLGRVDIPRNTLSLSCNFATWCLATDEVLACFTLLPPLPHPERPSKVDVKHCPGTGGRVRLHVD